MRHSQAKPWLHSSLALVGSSIISITLALLLSWNIFEVVVLYWIQAFIIGVFQRQKISDMVDFHGLSLNSLTLLAAVVVIWVSHLISYRCMSFPLPLALKPIMAPEAFWC